jgi:hypothetical protein
MGHFSHSHFIELLHAYYTVDRYWQVKKSTFMTPFLTKCDKHYFSIDLGDIT